MTTTYTNAAGEVVASYTSHQNWKSALDSNGVMTAVEQGHASRGLDLTSDEFKDLPDGNYKLTIAAHNDGPSPTEQSISYDFRVDTTPPVIERASVDLGDMAGPVLDLEISDESPIAGFTLHDPGSGLWFYRSVTEDDAHQWYSEGRYRESLSIGLGEFELGWTDQGGEGDIIAHPYLLAWDYGLNHSEAVTIDLPSDNEGPIAPCVSPTGGHWAHDSTGWWYACASGTDYLKGGWFTINGSDYLFGPNGYISTGFLQRPSGEWVYADSEGAWRAAGSVTVPPGITLIRLPRSCAPAGCSTAAPGTTCPTRARWRQAGSRLVAPGTTWTPTACGSSDLIVSTTRADPGDVTPKRSPGPALLTFQIVSIVSLAI